MSINIAAIRYARAFSQVLKGDIETGKKCLKELESVCQLYSIDDSRKILMSPVMPRDLKLEILEYALTTVNASKELRSFIQIIVESNRIDILPQISSKFAEILDALSGQIKAQVTTAVEISDADHKALAEELERVFSKKVVIEKSVNQEILGGTIIRVGYSLIDMSLKTRLNAITSSSEL